MKVFYTIFAIGIMTASCSETTSISLSNKPYSDNDGLLFYSAWRCSILAEFKDDPVEQTRLFELGFKVGKGFVNRALDKSMDEEEWKKAPIGVTWELSGGPSVDYRLGYLFKSITTDVYKTLTKEDSNGVPFDDIANWRDDDARKSYAESLFRKSNCSVLR